MLHLVSLSIVEHDWGNLYRDVWKWSAWMCCLDPNNDYTADERAVQGLLCGHLDSLLPNCQTWEDCLWAHLRVKMDRIVENGLRWYARRTKEGRELMQLPHSYWQSELTFENMFANVESFIKDIPGDKAATRHVFGSIQRHIITGDVGGLLALLSSWRYEGADDYQKLIMPRFMVHLAMLFRSYGSSDRKISEIVLKFVKCLPHLGISGSSIGIGCYLDALNVPADDKIRLYVEWIVELEKLCQIANDQRVAMLSQARLSGFDCIEIAMGVFAEMYDQAKKAAEEAEKADEEDEKDGTCVQDKVVS